MVVAKIGYLRFKIKDSHTVGYLHNVRTFMNSGEASEAGSQITLPIREGNFKWVMAETYEQAVEKLVAHASNGLSSIGWLEPNLEDFSIEVVHEDVFEDGYFWTPCKTDCRYYPLSK